MTQRVVVRLKGNLSTGYTVRLEIGEDVASINPVSIIFSDGNGMLASIKKS